MSQSPSASAYPYDTELVRELLKHKRKVRGIRSCFPCRHRKVRCDGHMPCSSCVKRNHPELCRVPDASEPGPTHSSSDSSGHRAVLSSQGLNAQEAQENGPDPNAIISRIERVESELASLKADLRASTGSHQASVHDGVHSPSTSPVTQVGKSHGQHFVEDATGATVYLGSHSDTPLALGCRQASGAEDVMLQNMMMDQFTPRTYPFTSLWGPEAQVKDVCETLPEDSDIVRYWQIYQSTAYPFYPALVTIGEFGSSLFGFLNQRASRETVSHHEEPNSSWLALLFAVLACGVQFSNDPIQERDLRSKVLICSSFQCLRMSNFFNRPDLDQIQSLALIGHCLRNNLDTNTAWILMGTSIRLAQSIGLHESLPSSAENTLRSRLWWMLIWQDTFLSFTYDRPPSPVNMNCPIPYAQDTEGHSFAESIFTICRILLDRTRQENAGTIKDPLQSTVEFKLQLERVWDTAAPFLISRSYCASLQDHLERLALGVHLHYAICRLNRVYLDILDDNERSTSPVVTECTHHATGAIESFLDLHRLSPSVCRSWAFVHNAVSCAITLKSLSPRAEGFLARLIGVLEKEDKNSEWCDADTNVRCFGPYSRALTALREICR